MNDQLAKYELHIWKDILFIYSFIVKVAPILPYKPHFQTKFEKLE